MKKLLLSLLLFPLMLGGCVFDKKDKGNENTPTQEEHYIDVKISEFSLKIGEEYQIEITKLKNTIVLCQSNNEEVAIVNQDGLVKAVGQGETSISITGGKDHFMVFVTVLPDEAKDSLQIVMVKDSFTIALDDEYVLPFTVKCGNKFVENPVYFYEFEHENIVSINGLYVTPISVGTTKCVVTATYNELSTSSSFTITVY